jgi:curved DNA-binding protein CbpA
LAADYALALLLHPDSSHPSASADHFATLNRAYKLLSTPAARNSYLSTGYGWSPSAGFDTGYSMRADDEAMREMIRRARRGGAAEWSGRGFRDAEAGKGAWAYRNVNGREWHPYDADGHASGGGDGLYMSNNKFMALVAALAGIWAVVQVMRIGGVADHTREALVDRHIR